MPRRLRPIMVAFSAAAITATGTGFDWASARLDPMVELAGRWAGQGTVMPASGPSESFKCVVTYIPDKDGNAKLRQNLRCKSDNYQLDAATQLQIEGTRVTGEWQDNIYQFNGTVAGTLTDGGFEVMLYGRFFQARMVVAAGSRCEQSVKVTPQRADYIREVSASLRKC